MDKKYLVTKSNYFIMNSSYDLSLEEQKIILTLASMVQPTDEEFKPYKFRIAEFMELVGVSDKSKYTEIPKMTKELMKKVFEIQEGNKLIQTAWLSGVIYEKGSGLVELTFSPYLKPYMLQLKEKFTQYQLGNILNMKSKYSPRIYEILKCNEFKKQGYIEIEFDELRKLLKADNIYPLYADFKRKVLIQTQKELGKISDISFEFEEIKTGRKVTSIKFKISKNNNAKNEIAVTAVAPIEGQQTIEDMDNIQAVKNIVGGIKDDGAMKIFKAAGGDIEVIKAKYSVVSKFKKVNNLTGAMIDAIKEDWRNEERYNRTFNNFESREYDYDELEKKLLGW